MQHTKTLQRGLLAMRTAAKVTASTGQGHHQPVLAVVTTRHSSSSGSDFIEDVPTHTGQVGLDCFALHFTPYLLLYLSYFSIM